jgi:DNA-binding NarL/FixJ family response regulator
VKVRFGEALLAAGRVDEAGAPLREAHAVLAGLGELVYRRRAEQGMRRCHVPVPRGPRRANRDSPGGLTERELEVARLVARGRTNAEIAQALVVTPRTAAAHVSSILTKLGFSSRAQIAEWEARQVRVG